MEKIRIPGILILLAAWNEWARNLPGVGELEFRLVTVDEVMREKSVFLKLSLM